MTDLLVGDQAVPFLQRDDHLLAGQMRTEAAMRTGAGEPLSR